MFTSSNSSVTPFSHLPSYSYNHSPPPLPPPPPPPHFSVEEASHDGFSYPQFPNQDPFFSNTQMPIFTENKDHNRHRKICTSQGVRDRRVRLSVDIARKFFDLQDMLGFDKASKTLEWLLIKSRKSIRKLSDPNHNIGGSTTNYSLRTSTPVVPENGDLEEILNLPKSMSSLVGVSNTSHQSKMKKIMENLGAQKSVRSTERARARARAREGIMPCSLKVDANQIEDVPRQESIISNTRFPNLPQIWDISNVISGSGVYGEPAMGTHNNHEYYQ